MDEGTVTRRLRTLRTPKRIQAFLDALPYNFEEGGETCSSPARVLMRGSAHCLEGALLAAAALALSGERPLLMHLRAGRADAHHAVALFRENGFWGAISKTNHAVLRFRDPVYRTPRELALSYFHEYFIGESGRKTLKAYSRPYLLRGRAWMTAKKELWDIAYALADAPHIAIADAKALSRTRPATPFERRVMDEEEWKRP